MNFTRETDWKMIKWTQCFRVLLLGPCSLNSDVLCCDVQSRQQPPLDPLGLSQWGRLPGRWPLGPWDMGLPQPGIEPRKVCAWDFSGQGVSHFLFIELQLPSPSDNISHQPPTALYTALCKVLSVPIHCASLSDKSRDAVCLDWNSSQFKEHLFI